MQDTITTVNENPTKKREKKPPVNWENKLSEQMEEAGLPQPIRQYQGIPGRKFSFDFAWPRLMIAVEVEGATFGGGGRHNSGVGYQNDCRKYNLAAKHGWVVYRFTSYMVREKEAVEFLKEIFLREATRLIQEVVSEHQ